MFKGMALGLFLSSMAFANELVIWNVGQGQWVSEIHKNFCIHYDMGGEKNISSRVSRECTLKMNYIHLSHWDWDHISFVRSFFSKVQKACLFPPATEAPNSFKKKFIQAIPHCNSQETSTLSKDMRILFHPWKSLKSNDASEVVYSKTFSTVIPGDSPHKEERIWQSEVPTTAQGLILGHHGSRTSTSRGLLIQMTNLKWAVATARKKRYGHPHREVIEALKKEKVPLLLTEDWGHLHFIKNEADKD